VRDLEEYCVVIRSYKVRQRHIIRTEPVRKNKVCPLSWLGCLTCWVRLKEFVRVIKSELNEEANGQQTC